MKKFYLSFLLLIFSVNSFSQELLTPYEKSSNKNTTAQYEEIITYYQELAKRYKQIKIEEVGLSDAGQPIHLVSISNGTMMMKAHVLINNGIHPGEPEGIDASMMLARDLLTNKELNALLNRINVYIIPVYNVDGCVNRNSHSRTNQNGPESYGFRGNAINLDLNRDFIKMDSRNTFAFAKIFHKVKPHIFIDTHTSNGADYQHIITYIATQKDKLEKGLSNYLNTSLEPRLRQALLKKNYDIVPYVNAWSQIPDSGWAAFFESPRYATGYTTLFNSIGLTLEMHMLKAFNERIEASYDFLVQALMLSAEDSRKLIQLKNAADTAVLSQTIFPVNWKLDSTKYDLIPFKGYKAGYKKSDVSGFDRLYYDRNQKTGLQVKFYNDYIPTKEIQKPYAYIIPAAWQELIARLHANDILLETFKESKELEAEVYYIGDYRTLQTPYEGHYLHSGVKLRSEMQKLKVYPGDYLIRTDQKHVRFLLETLEPEARDSYFNWNFFDAILGQKEHFSDYVFEDTAAGLLKNDASLQKLLNDKKANDSDFAKNSQAQLEFIYRNSVYFEKSYLRYPVYRLNQAHE